MTTRVDQVLLDEVSEVLSRNSDDLWSFFEGLLGLTEDPQFSILRVCRVSNHPGGLVFGEYSPPLVASLGVYCQGERVIYERIREEEMRRLLGVREEGDEVSTTVFDFMDDLCNQIREQRVSNPVVIERLVQTSSA